MIDKRKVITEIPNLKIDIESARKWYERVETEFQDQRWYGFGGCASENPWATDKGSGWGLQTLNEDTSAPYHAYENHEVDDYTLYRKTDCCVDWASRVVDTFPTAHRSVVGVAPPAAIVTPHTDQKDKIKIHIPIYADETHWWATADGLYHMHPGKAYILDVSQMHGTMNCGHNTRVHVILICYGDVFDEIYNLNLTI